MIQKKLEPRIGNPGIEVELSGLDSRSALPKITSLRGEMQAGSQGNSNAEVAPVG